MGVPRDMILKHERPDSSVFYIRTDTGVQVCGSPRRKKDDNCGNPHGLSPWNGRCRLHGKDSPGHKVITGVSSQVRKRLSSMLGDPSLLDMRRPISVLALACERAMKRLDSLDTPAFRKRALKFVGKYHAADSDEERTEAIAHLEDWLRHGGDEDAAFRDFVNAAKDLLHGQDKTLKIALDARQAITQAQLVGIFSKFLVGLRSTYGADGAKPMEKWMTNHILQASQVITNGS